MELIIGNKNYSSWSLRPWLLMKHFEVAFEERKISLYSAETASLLDTYCPNKKVPVLNDGNVTVWDSLAICEYINEQYLDGKGYQNDGTKRAIARSLACEMHSGFVNIRTYMSMDIRASNKKYDTNNNELAKEIQRIDDIFASAEGEFLCGEFGIVDCFFAPVAFRFRTYNVALSDKAQQYQQKLLALPAMKLWENDALEETEMI